MTDSSGQKVVSDEELLDELYRVTEKIGRPPRPTDMRDHAKHQHRTYYTRFESDWVAILEMAGLDPDERYPYLTPNELLEILDELIAEGKADDFGGVATTVLDNHLDESRKRIVSVLKKLEDRGDVDRVRGVCEHGVRYSWLPTAGGEDDE